MPNRDNSATGAPSADDLRFSLTVVLSEAIPPGHIVVASGRAVHGFRITGTGVEEVWRADRRPVLWLAPDFEIERGF